MPFPFSNATGDVKTMQRLWDKFKLPHFLIFWDTRTSHGKASRPYKWRAVDRWRPLLNEITRTPLFSLPIMSLTKSRCRATIQGRVVAFHNFLYIFLFFDVFLIISFSFSKILSVWLELWSGCSCIRLETLSNPLPSRRATKGRTWHNPFAWISYALH